MRLRLEPLLLRMRTVTEREAPPPKDTARGEARSGQSGVFTFAVNVTDWPNAEGFCDDVTAVVVAAAFTSWPPDSVPILPEKPLPPLYSAVTP